MDNIAEITQRIKKFTADKEFIKGEIERYQVQLADKDKAIEALNKDLDAELEKQAQNETKP